MKSRHFSRSCPASQPSNVQTCQRSNYRVNLPECALTEAQLCNPFRYNTYKTPRNNHKTCSFKSSICNTYARQLCNPCRFNTCKKHTGWGSPLWKSSAFRFSRSIPARYQLSTVNLRIRRGCGVPRSHATEGSLRAAYQLSHPFG